MQEQIPLSVRGARIGRTPHTGRRPLDVAMTVIDMQELERLVRETFPKKRLFSVATEFDLAKHRAPAMVSVHGGSDPFLDRAFDAWLNGSPTFVALYRSSIVCAVPVR